MKFWGGCLLPVILLFLSPDAAFSHPSPNTSFELDIRKSTVTAQLKIPLVELELAFGRKLSLSSQSSVTQFESELKDYISTHLRLYEVGSSPWEMKFLLPLTVTKNEIPVDLVAHLTFSPPRNLTPRKFIIESDLVVHQVVNHRVVVVLRSDVDLEKPLESPRIVGMIRYLRSSVSIDRLQGSARQVFEDTFKLGVTHILEGIDHLVFLLMLLLPAPMLVEAGRWSGFAGFRTTLIQLIKTVSAFTLGHSVTLVLGSLNLFKIPSRTVEIVIAASVLISAIHALRPVFPKKEFWIAGGFGLIHGLAFSSIIASFHVDSGQLALSVLGFNLGIEFVQLALVCAVSPILIVLNRSDRFKWVRFGAAFFGIGASVVWLFERFH